MADVKPDVKQKHKATIYLSRETEIALKRLQMESVEAGLPEPTLTDLADRGLLELIERERKKIRAKTKPA